MTIACNLVRWVGVWTAYASRGGEARWSIGFPVKKEQKSNCRSSPLFSAGKKSGVGGNMKCQQRKKSGQKKFCSNLLPLNYGKSCPRFFWRIARGSWQYFFCSWSLKPWRVRTIKILWFNARKREGNVKEEEGKYFSPNCVTLFDWHTRPYCNPPPPTHVNLHDARFTYGGNFREKMYFESEVLREFAMSAGAKYRTLGLTINIFCGYKTPIPSLSSRHPYDKRERADKVHSFPLYFEREK